MFFDSLQHILICMSVTFLYIQSQDEMMMEKDFFEFILLLIIFYFCGDIFVLRSSTKEANLMDSDSLKV